MTVSARRHRCIKIECTSGTSPLKQWCLAQLRTYAALYIELFHTLRNLENNGLRPTFVENTLDDTITISHQCLKSQSLICQPRLKVIARTAQHLIMNVVTEIELPRSMFKWSYVLP